MNTPTEPTPASKSRPGRPRALNEIKRREICAIVSMGASFENAARYVGCAVSTIRREARRNAEFNEALRRSSFSAEITPLQAIREAAKKYWRAAAWLLERIDPQRFARRDARVITPEGFAHCIEEMAEAIGSEIPDEAVRNRVIKRLAAISKDSNRQSWANRETAPLMRALKKSQRAAEKRRPKFTPFEFRPDDPRAIKRRQSQS